MSTKTKLVREAPYILKDLDKAGEVAMFYGFQSVKTPKIEKSDVDLAKSLAPDFIEHAKSSFPRPEEKCSLLRTITEWELHNNEHPLMLHYRRAVTQLPVKRSADERHYSLDIIGSIDSISEAIAIRTALAILNEHGERDLMVDINSIGDKHSVTQFEKELTNFTRKHGGDAPSDVKQQIKKDPFNVWHCNHCDWIETRKRAPQSLSHLSEASVNHFQEVLEHLETLEVPYRINPTLLGHRQFCSHTIFEIKSAPQAAVTETKELVTITPPDSTEETFAIGTRHNYLARRAGFKRETPIMSVNIRLKKNSPTPKLLFKKKPDPRFFYIQFGTMAKFKSLPIIESLRQAHIPVHHMLTSDKFLAQLAVAEKLRTPYVIIMGQKEALENSVVVREMSNRSQETVPVHHLAHYLSKIR
jgi:histidyl-tRNA synthetase